MPSRYLGGICHIRFDTELILNFDVGIKKATDDLLIEHWIFGPPSSWATYISALAQIYAKIVDKNKCGGREPRGRSCKRRAPADKSEGCSLCYGTGVQLFNRENHRG